MNNAILVNALRGAASAAGYHLRNADDDRLSAPSAGFPAALLSPPVVRSAKGRRHGRIEYEVTLRLADLGADLPPAKRYPRRQKLENDALAIFTSLSCNERIIAVEDLTVVQQPSAASIHGEIAVVAKARVITFF